MPKPRKKHRLSGLYEDQSVERHAQMLEEDTLAVSPVEVDYPNDKTENEWLTEEVPRDADAAEPVMEGYPVEEEALPEPVTLERYTEETCVTIEPEVVAEPPSGEDYYPEEAHAEPEPLTTCKEVTAIEEVPSEYALAAEAAAEDVPVEEETATYLHYGKCNAEELAAAQEPKNLGKTSPEDAIDEAASDTEQNDDNLGEVVVICTSCTRMLLIEYNGTCPYSVTSLMGYDSESYSWLLYTTCFSCTEKHKHALISRDMFSHERVTAFKTAILSEEFMKRTYWFEVADRVCRKPLKIVMDKERMSVVYEKVDVLREETTDVCRIRGLKSVDSRSEKGRKSNLINSFAPGGFM